MFKPVNLYHKGSLLFTFVSLEGHRNLKGLYQYYFNNSLVSICSALCLQLSYRDRFTRKVTSEHIIEVQVKSTVLFLGQTTGRSYIRTDMYCISTVYAEL